VTLQHQYKQIVISSGTLLHPSYWPQEELHLTGKRVAIVGTGSTGVQLATELSKVTSHLTVFQRTPNMALPMRQVQYNPPTQALPREAYPDLFSHRKDSFSGFSFSFIPRTTFADTAEQRRQVYEKLWAEGDFQFWLATYCDMLFDREANAEAYHFWRDKVRARIHDVRVKDTLAPMQQPHAFGCKRVSLEKGYFEIFNQDNVTLVDISEAGTPIKSITAQGIVTRDQEYIFDVIICATGYDAVTGGLTQIDIRGRSGSTLQQAWSTGVATYLGMASRDFPNMFFTYGPQAPTAFCNGPTCVELQGDWIINILGHMKECGLQVVEVLEQSQKEWKELVWKLAGASLLPTVDSWYMGTNVPGKPRESWMYLGGVPAYYKALEEVAGRGYEGFQLA
jgi:cation diffusion facilitator CzcD-associated flavoprotein CzcO